MRTLAPAAPRLLFAEPLVMIDVAGCAPPGRYEAPRGAYLSNGFLYWYEEYVLSVLRDDFILEREVLI